MMSFNLPAHRLLKLTKGTWADVRYPATAVVQVHLQPRDYFEPVEPDAARSCVPVGGKDFSCLFDSNSGKMTVHGPTMFPPLSVTYRVNDDAFEVVFVGRCMQITQELDKSDAIDSLLTCCEHTLPSLLSTVTGLSIFCDTLEIGIGDHVEARSETFIPLTSFRVVDAEQRVAELQRGIEFLGAALPSARITLACSYLREALFFDATYFGHNPYTHSLIVILKCAQTIEVLFGGQRDAIRDRCKAIAIAEHVIESQIIPIVLTRSSLGPAHASAFVPTPSQVEVLRAFAQRSVHTVRQLLVHIMGLKLYEHAFLIEPVKRDVQKDKLMMTLEAAVKAPRWCADGDVEVRHVGVPDPRLAPPSI